MRIVIDTETNSLIHPTKIWCVCCKDIDTGDWFVFRNLTEDEREKLRFKDFAQHVSLWIGHNLLGYDLPVLRDLVGIEIGDVDRYVDTLIVSKLVDYPRAGHSLESYGEEFGVPKDTFSDFTRASPALEARCTTDVEINHKVYLKYLRYLSNDKHKESILLEHKFQLIVNSLSTNGFFFNSTKANILLTKVTKELSILDKDILEAFTPKLKFLKEVVPKETKHGTIHKGDFRFVKDGDLSIYNGGPFCRCEWVVFNPASHKQIVDVLHEANWSPIERTKTYIDTERELNALKRKKPRDHSVDIAIEACNNKIIQLERYGWKINEANLDTLPITAPASARTLAKRILLESRRRTLTEWLGLVHPDDQRIHGRFYGIGAWTHRMAHQQPNTANIPSELNLNGTKKLLGKEMRQLWSVPPGRLLVGVDAEGIQLRIFAHYIDDPEFTLSLVEGRKDDKTDPHSLNQRVLGSVCKSRAAAKRFIYALLLGAGLDKLAEILGCSREEAERALFRLMSRYTGFAYLKEEVIPKDASRGYFIGLDDRKVRIPGETLGTRRHLCMSGYLQNGEAVVMKKAAVLWHQQLIDEKLDFLFVNMVHDEWQTECDADMSVAMRIAEIQSDSLRIVGEELKLKCPLAGSYWNEDHKDYTIGTNWYQTH